MSPRQEAGREDWVQAALSMLDEGRLPAEVSPAELCARLGAAEESLRSHFGEDGSELHAAVISQWLREWTAALPRDADDAVRDPLDRVRLIRAAMAATAVRDGAMRRWAAAEPAAAAAVAEANRVLTRHLLAALTDIGLTGTEPAALAAVLAAALWEPVTAEPDGFETVMKVLARSAAVPPGAPSVEHVAGPAADQVVEYIAETALTADQRRTLRRIAQAFAAGQGAEEVLPGREQPAADET